MKYTSAGLILVKIQIAQPKRFVTRPWEKYLPNLVLGGLSLHLPCGFNTWNFLNYFINMPWLDVHPTVDQGLENLVFGLNEQIMNTTQEQHYISGLGSFSWIWVLLQSHLAQPPLSIYGTTTTLQTESINNEIIFCSPDSFPEKHVFSAHMRYEICGRIGLCIVYRQPFHGA